MCTYYTPRKTPHGFVMLKTCMVVLGVSLWQPGNNFVKTIEIQQNPHNAIDTIRDCHGDRYTILEDYRWRFGRTHRISAFCYRSEICKGAEGNGTE